MTFVIGQAIYGERDRGHRLLAASPAFPDAEHLAGRMDMQGSPPPHTFWEPYFSGFCWKDHYILARTMVDPQATRAGMVFSRALAIPMREAANCSDITGLIAFLTKSADARADVGDIAWRPDGSSGAGHAGLVQALLQEGSETVVWPGQDGFAQALAALWAALWPTARLALSFRIAFSPTDVASDTPSLVVTPTSLLTRWSGYTVVHLDASPDRADVAERHLLQRLPGSELDDILRDFGVLMDRISSLRQIVGMLDLARDGGTFADYVDGLRLACYLAPEESIGANIKAVLLDRAMGVLAGASAADIRMLRNLDLIAVGTRAAFWSGIKNWAATSLWRDTDICSAANLVNDAYTNKPLAPWRDAITTGLRYSLSRPTDEASQALWRILAERPSLLATLARRGNGSVRSLEAALLRKLPKSLDAKAADALAAGALTLRLPTVHAACCAAALPAADAIARHLADAAPTAQSLAIAVAKANGEERVTAALQHDSELMLVLAAQAVARTPSILRRMDVRNPRWRQIWSEALRIDLGLIERQPRATQALADLLNEVIDTDVDVEQLLYFVSQTSVANLRAYPRRSEIWSHLPSSSSSSFLAATADSWLTAIQEGEEEICEEPLARVVAEPGRLEPALSRLVHRGVEACHLFRALPALKERNFEQWFRAALDRGRPLSSPEAEACGRLIAARDWNDSARRLSDAITDERRYDLRPAVEYVVEMVGMIRRYLLDEGGSRTPVSARWRILEEIALELYGYGPGDNSLWQRSGGKESDIPKTDTGAQSWRKILEEAAKGKRAVDIGRMLRTMAGDYPNNRTLQKLVNDAAFNGR